MRSRCGARRRDHRHPRQPAGARIAAGADCDVLAFGHTHQPWIAEYGGVLLVNCGSVGKPKDGGPLGGFAVLEADGAAVSARIERFDYDARLRRLRRDRHRRPL
ncbi:MAG: metallophosphoesterase family protein [Thermoleophilaceae bacterium]